MYSDGENFLAEMIIYLWGAFEKFAARLREDARIVVYFHHVSSIA